MTLAVKKLRVTTGQKQTTHYLRRWVVNRMRLEAQEAGHFNVSRAAEDVLEEWARTHKAYQPLSGVVVRNRSGEVAEGDNKRVTFSIMMSNALYERLKTEALAFGKSFAWFVSDVLEQHYAQTPKKP